MEFQTKCKICRAGPQKLIKKKKEYSYCPECQFIFTLERYFPDPKTEKQRYLSHNNSMDNQGYINFLTAFLKSSVFPYASPGSYILDFGCGHTPVLTYLLEKKGYRVTKYDKYFYPEKKYRGTKFDMIVLVEVIEHLSQPLKTLKNLKKHLTPKGIISINTRFHPGDPKDFLTWWYRRDPTHRSFFSQKTLQILAERLNFPTLSLKSEDKCVLSN